MSLQINDKNNINHEMRTLIVNDTEKYRLMANNTLMYAKGQIKFDLNLPKDGSHNLISYSYNHDKDRSEIYAFYNDGFYRKNNDNSWTFRGNNLISINSLTSEAANFDGWYTEPDGNNKVNSIEDVFRKTNLFKYNDNISIPKIILYAHWTIHTYTVYINNITRTSESNKTGSSSFYYQGHQRFGTLQLNNIPYNTEIISYIGSKISNLKYITWAKDRLDRTEYQQLLREGQLQPFIGWHTNNNSNGQILDFYHVTNTTNLYPQFQALVIWPRTSFYNNGNSGYGYSHRIPPFSLNKAKEGEPEGGNNMYYGNWTYDESKFPLGSSGTYVVGLNWGQR